MSCKRLTKETLKAALPDTSSPLTLEGLDDTVQIYRDAFGVPHVKARSMHDAFYGQGFAAAQDRFWHMDHDRRWAYGRWAELVGKAGVEQDSLMRKLQVRSSVESDYRSVNSETRAMFDAYSEGVNAFLESAGSPPIEYRLLETEPKSWEPWDSIAVFKARHIMMGLIEAKIWRARLVNALGPERAARLMPGYPKGHLLIVPPGTEHSGDMSDALEEFGKGAEPIAWLGNADAGSNNWALSGSRTASGKPLVAGDPHRPLDTPNVYYQNHVACPEFDAIGLSFPGCPGFPHFGHNAHVAWCVTHAAADYQDLYVERFKEDDPILYEFKGEWKEAEVRYEAIKVRGGKPITLEVTVTQHGPVFAGDPTDGYGIAFKYTATTGPNLGLQCLPRMLRADSANAIDESMRDWVDPSNNFVFADVHGNVGYLNRGRLPVRSRANAWLPVPGWTGEHEWRGFVPFEELARIRNPENGYIVTANNKIVGDEYPHYIGIQFAPEFRARRIHDRLKDIQDATVEDMKSVHAERVSIPGRTYARLVSQVKPKDEYTTWAHKILTTWDGSMERDEVAPTIYSTFRMYLDFPILRYLLNPLAEEALAAGGRGAPVHVNMLRAELSRMAEENDTSMLPPGSDWKSLMTTALDDAVAYLRERLGDNVGSWTWGRVHATRPHHWLSASFPETASLLDPPSVPLGGDGDTPQAASHHPSDPFTITATSVARYVFDTSDWDKSVWITPLGVSGHPGSPHYADQAPIWGELEYVPMLYGWDRIAANAESVQELKGREGA